MSGRNDHRPEARGTLKDNQGDPFIPVNLREGYLAAFDVASTSTNGGAATTTADLLKVTRNGCIQLLATSTNGTATPIKLNLDTKGATSTHPGTEYFDYGTCP